MPKLPILFIDDGGVLSDNSKRAPEWRRLLGEFFPSRLGGTAEDWAEANRAVFPPLFERMWSALDDRPGFRAFDRAYETAWLAGMAAHIGIAMPPHIDVYDLAAEATRYVTHRAQASIPGSAEALRTLHTAGFTIYAASGGRTYELDGYFTGMGIRDCFREIYGTDIVDIAKAGPAYYRAIFADAGIEPSDALVIDDSLDAIAWAASTGASTLQVTPEHPFAHAAAELLKADNDRSQPCR